MAETPSVMPQLHMPLQSGSDRILKAMRRSYRSDRFLGILDRVRAKIPNAAISTDIIVGFPGETEEDFAATLDVVEQARFASAFTFQYSIRPGTPPPTCPTSFPKRLCRNAINASSTYRSGSRWKRTRGRRHRADVRSCA
jgi:tRNA-2-methylthio-N6-dimethylallyladenosine synthase